MRVTEIAKKACKGRKGLRKVTIGDNIRKIGQSAFDGASGINLVIIESVRISSIGAHAFRGIAANAEIRIRASAAQFRRIKKLLKKSGLGKKVKLRRLKT